MRPLETLLILTFPTVLLLSRRHRKWLLAPALVAALQFIAEGYRWQLIPAYLLSVIALGMSFTKKPARSVLTVVGAGLLALGFAVAIALPVVLPVPRPAGPTGPYPVGTTTFHLIDNSRTDPYAPDPSSPREILVQVWYPAQDVEQYPLAPWMEDPLISARGVSQIFELPDFTFDHLVYATTNSYKAPPVLDMGQAFPVILFSHGYQGFRAQNTFQTQELASYGYIVAAVEHTYGSIVTVFPDGRIAEHNEDTILEGDLFEPSFEALAAQWADDLAFALDRLTDMNAAPGDLLNGKLDLGKVASLGHSTGGGAALQFCYEDARCLTAFGMDPALAALADDMIASGYTKPFLAVFSEAWANGPDHSVVKDLYANARSDYSSYYIEGTPHFDFSDLPAATPLAHFLGLKGPIEGDRVLEIINKITIAYFDQHLNGRAPDWTSSPQEMLPEVVPFDP